MTSKIINVLKNSPRVGLNNITNFAKKPKGQPRGRRVKTKWRKQPVWGTQKTFVGFERDKPMPWFLTVPEYGYNRENPLKRNYQPLTLWKLQRLIDLGRIDTSLPIDLTTIAKARGIDCSVEDLGYGLFLTEQGADIFEAKINIEVQIANELVISAIERNGGTITVAYYDKMCIPKLYNPVNFFLTGNPIPKRALPPRELIEYYSDPTTRGYLSNPLEVKNCRNNLAQRFGYELSDIEQDENYEMLSMKKDPRQLYYGLAPGWIVNLHDKNIIKPNDEYVKSYYET